MICLYGIVSFHEYFKSHRDYNTFYFTDERVEAEKVPPSICFRSSESHTDIWAEVKTASFSKLFERSFKDSDSTLHIPEVVGRVWQRTSDVVRVTALHLRRVYTYESPGFI